MAMMVSADSFKYHSEENVSVAVSESSPPVSVGAHCSPQFGPAAVQPQYHQHHLQPRAADDQRAITNDHHMTTSILKQLEQGHEMQAELQEVIADLQVYIVSLSGSVVCLLSKVGLKYLWIRLGSRNLEPSLTKFVE